EKATSLWLNKSKKNAARDHDLGGSAEQAEYAVINPMIKQICGHSQLSNWGACISEICSGIIPFGTEIPYIVDVTDSTNPINYNLNEYVNIKMGDREEIKLRLHLENSMVIGNNVNWQYTHDGGQVNGSKEIIFRKNQLKDTPEIVNVT